MATFADKVTKGPVNGRSLLVSIVCKTPDCTQMSSNSKDLQFVRSDFGD